MLFGLLQIFIEVLSIITMAVITSMAACKRLFSSSVCRLSAIMYTVVLCRVTLVTAVEGSTGCVSHTTMIGMPRERFGLQSGQVLPLM